MLSQTGNKQWNYQLEKIYLYSYEKDSKPINIYFLEQVPL